MKVSKDRWQAAQEWERRVWVSENSSLLRRLARSVFAKLGARNFVGDDWGVFEVVGPAGVTRALAELKKSDGLSVGPVSRRFYLGGEGSVAWLGLMLREARDRWRALAKAEKARGRRK